jgi:hypothetical protein
MAEYEWVQPEEPTPRRRGIPWFWLLLGFVVLMMFLNSRAQQQPQPRQPGRRPSSTPFEPSQAQRPAPSRPDGPQREGDWSLEEMPGQPNAQVPASTTAQAADTAAPAPPKKTAEGDWQIEEVAPNGEAPHASQPATQKPAAPAAPPDKSSKGDWTIEELKPNQSPDPKRE